MLSTVLAGMFNHDFNIKKDVDALIGSAVSGLSCNET